MFGRNSFTAPPVTTMLTRDERLRLDAAGNGVFAATHRDTIDDVLRDLRGQRARAVIVSTAFCRYSSEVTRVARVVREFPQIPTVALISQLDQGTARAVLTLGQCGIRTLVDVREPTGWRELRDLLAREHTTEIGQLAVAHIHRDLATAPPGARRFFEVLFSVAPQSGGIHILASGLQILPSTLMSRFFRAELPPPRRFLNYARLIFAARMFENPGLSIANIAMQLEYSSAQSFGRHVRTTLDLSAADFRRRFDSRGMLQRLRDDLVLAHRERWQSFDPLISTRGGRRPRPAEILLET